MSATRPRGRPRRDQITVVGAPVQGLREARPALHEEARTCIRGMIVRGHLAPSTSIGELAMSKALSMSRTPVREALKLLETEGLVQLRSNRGARVSAIDPDEIADLFEVAAGLERMGAELAAVRITDQELAHLHNLQDHMDALHAAGDLDRYFEINQSIHLAIVAAGKNNVLQRSHEFIFAQVERVRYMALAVRGRWAESVNEHHDLLGALEAHDGAAAGTIMAHHVQRTGKLALDLITSLNRDEVPRQI